MHLQLLGLKMGLQMKLQIYIKMKHGSTISDLKKLIFEKYGNKIKHKGV